MYIKDNRYTQQLVDFLRQEQPVAITTLRELWRQQDLEKSGEIDIVSFTNILLNNVDQITEQLVINFQKEYLNYHNNHQIDYISFIDKYLSETSKSRPVTNKNSRKPSGSNLDSLIDLKNINTILQQISEKVDQNITFIVRYYSDREGNIITKELIDHLRKMQVSLTRSQIDEF